jgi:hypothetical protein
VAVLGKESGGGEAAHSGPNDGDAVGHGASVAKEYGAGKGGGVAGGF